MRICKLLASTVIGASVAVFCIGLNANADDGAQDVQRIKAIEHKIAEAKTTDQLMSYFDKDIVLYDFVPPLKYEGFEAVRAHEESIFFSKAKNIKVEFLDLDVIVDGKLGVARSIQHFSWTEDGKPREGTWRGTDIYRKINGEWKVIHAHASVPIDPKTGQGQMDLSLNPQNSVPRGP
jgi:ketosteroid isomerase-like protein